MKTTQRFVKTVIGVAFAVMVAAVAGFCVFGMLRQANRDQAIMEAAFRSNFDEVIRLAEHGANPNGPPFRFEQGEWRHRVYRNGNPEWGFDTPVEMACKAGRFDVAKRLISMGVDLSKPNRHGATLLFWALQRDNLDMFTFLLKKGVSPNEVAPGGCDFNILSHIVDLSWHSDWKGDPTAFAQVALSHGADPNQHGMHGFTPLISAVSWEKVGLIDLFLKNGGRITEEDKARQNAMDKASFRSNAKIVDLLVRYGGQYTIQEAVCLGRLADVERLLKEDPDAVRRVFVIDGNSLLGLALERGNEPVSALLLSADSDVSFLNEDKETLLHLAARGGNEAMISELLRRGLSPNAKDQSHETPLHETTFQNREKAAKLLISAGANINARQSSGITPVMWASCYDSPLVLKALLDAGANPNEHSSSDIATPLGSACHYASSNSVPESVKILLSNGADVNGIGAGGRPPIHWAVGWFGGRPLVEYLLEHGANPAIRDMENKTAYDIARQNGNLELVEFLEGWKAKQQ